MTKLYNEDGTLNEEAQSAEVREKYQEVDPTPQSSFPAEQTELDGRALMMKVVAPVLASGAVVIGGSFTGIRAFKRRQDRLVDSYASEMVYHSGDEEEMRMCHAEFKRKLGPKQRRKAMMVKYLEVFMKKKVVTSQAVLALKFVFSLFKLSEEETGALLVETAESMRKQPASRGKLLFFGERILTTAKGKESLQPIRKMLASNYRTGGADIVDVSQKSMGETAYKAAVVARGKERAEEEGLTVGWDVLGLDQATATSIFDEVMGGDFESDALSYYKYQSDSPEYDEHGNLAIDSPFDEGKKEEDYYADLSESMKMARGLIDKDGKRLYDAQGRIKKTPATTPVPGTAVYECGNCGYTLFPAKGREFKFFPDDYKCPECGASKDQFSNRNDDEE